jgi:hypothetical protein
MLLWAALLWWRPAFWPRADTRFERPWREVGWAFLAVLGVILVGQLYARGIRLAARGPWRPLTESANQIVIFAPMLLLLWLRRHGPETAWIRRDRVPLRIALGLVLASLAIVGYVLVQRQAPTVWIVLSRVFHPRSTHVAVQVLLEDIAIAILFVRLASAIGPRVTVALVASLFAAGHVPSLMAQGTTSAELLGLIRDAIVTGGVLLVAARGADVWVLWPIHFAMDMMQFAIPGRPA